MNRYETTIQNLIWESKERPTQETQHDKIYATTHLLTVSSEIRTAMLLCVSSQKVYRQLVKELNLRCTALAKKLLTPAQSKKRMLFS